MWRGAEMPWQMALSWASAIWLRALVLASELWLFSVGDLRALVLRRKFLQCWAQARLFLCKSGFEIFVERDWLRQLRRIVVAPGALLVCRASIRSFILSVCLTAILWIRSSHLSCPNAHSNLTGVAARKSTAFARGWRLRVAPRCFRVDVPRDANGCRWNPVSASSQRRSFPKCLRK